MMNILWELVAIVLWVQIVVVLTMCAIVCGVFLGIRLSGWLFGKAGR